uniref:Uncharacterized protein n=1 Tax=Romanomermis culicivorax TaxID=13658 RepID=A0A915K147_ROMCU
MLYNGLSESIIGEKIVLSLIKSESSISSSPNCSILAVLVDLLRPKLSKDSEILELMVDGAYVEAVDSFSSHFTKSSASLLFGKFSENA